MGLVFMILFPLLSYTPIFAANNENDKIRVVLDPGHGGIDGGASSASKAEKYYNFEVAWHCKRILEKTGKFDVYLTRDSDIYKTLLERALTADSVNADIMLSLHFNSSDISTVKGSEIIVSTIEKYALTDFANTLKRSLTDNAGLKVRGNGIFTRPDTGDGTYLYYWSDIYNWDIPDDRTVGPLSDYHGITTWGCKFGIPTMIVEYAYLSNEDDLALADDSKSLEKMAEATAAALEKYYTNHRHNYADSSIDYPSSCVFRGKCSKKCTVCGHKIDVKNISDTPDENAHCFIKSKTVPSTCTNRGYILYECRYHQNLIDKGYYDGDAPSCHFKKVYLDYAEHDYKPSKSHNIYYIMYACTMCKDSYSKVSPYNYARYVLTRTVKNTIGTVVDFFDTFTDNSDIFEKNVRIPITQSNTFEQVTVN